MNTSLPVPRHVPRENMNERLDQPTEPPAMAN
jgi:hypothetical protein